MVYPGTRHGSNMRPKIDQPLQESVLINEILESFEMSYDLVIEMRYFPYSDLGARDVGCITCRSIHPIVFKYGVGSSSRCRKLKVSCREFPATVTQAMDDQYELLPRKTPTELHSLWHVPPQRCPNSTEAARWRLRYTGREIPHSQERCDNPLPFFSQLRHCRGVSLQSHFRGPSWAGRSANHGRLPHCHHGLLYFSPDETSFLYP